MSRGLIHNSLQSGLAANLPTTYPSDYDVAFYYATDSDTLYKAVKPSSGTTASWDIVGGSNAVQLTDADASISANNSGRTHLIPNVSADRTFTLPTAAEGLYFPFVGQITGADGHDWIFDTGSDTNFFVGGVLYVDDAPAANTVNPDGNSNSILQVNVPEGGTHLFFYCDGTNWTVWGVVNAAATPAFSDQA